MSQTATLNYNKIGPVYIVNEPGKKQAVLSVMEWKDAGEKDNWHYFLQLHNIENNSIINKKEISLTHKKWEPEQVIGKLGKNLWILTDSLVAYDQYSLEPVTNETKLKEINLFVKDNFSRYPNSYLLDEAAEVMYLRTESGDKYKLYPGDLALKPDDGINEKAADDYDYEIAANYRLYDRYELKSALTCIDTLHNMLYILGSEKETGFVLSYFGTAIFPERDETRQLTLVPYHADGEKLDYKKHPPITSIQQYYKAAFLQQKFLTAAWKSNIGERMILYQTDNKNKSAICIALVDNDGKEKWKTDTGMNANNFIDYLFSDKNLLLWFKIYQKEKSYAQTILVNIDLSNGHARNMNVADN